MKAEDFGYNPKTMIHSKRLSHAESAFLGILWVDHWGKNNKISADHLAVKFARAYDGTVLYTDDGYYNKKALEFWKRMVRHMQNHFLNKHDDVPVLSQSGYRGGYWIAENKEEAEAFYTTFRKRGLTGLVKASRGRQAAIIDAVGQLAFEFEDLADATGIAEPTIPGKKHLAPQIVDALLEKMIRDPESFAPNLRKIREKFFSGAILLEKERLKDMQDKVKDVLTALTGLSG